MLKSLLTPYAWNSAPALNGAIQKTLSAALESKYYPALSAGVVRLIKPNSSQESFSLEFGHAACGVLQADPPPNTSKQLVSVSDKFHLGSCGKAMTALMMYDVISSDPDISWNSTIGDFMPNVNSHWKDISLLDLMSHQAGVDDNTMLNGLRSSGIGKYADILSAVNGQLFKGTHDMIFKLWKPYLDEESSLKELDPAERVKITRHQRIKSKVEQYQPNPRGKYSYSNLGVSIAANMIELHTGQPFEVLMKEKFADPLGLQSFGFGAPGKTQENQPLGHCNDSFFGVNNRSFSPYEDPVPEIIQAAGNMHLNMSDWLRTLSANLILGRTLSTMPPMYCQQVPVSKFGKGVGYGAGWITQNTASNKTVQSKANHIEELCISDKPEHQMKIIHDGSNAQWMAICFVDFSLGIASALVTNTSHARILLQFSKVLQNITLNALETEVTKNKSNPE